MKTNYEIRYAAHPADAKSYDTTRLRHDFLIEKVFADDEVNLVYSMYDRMVVGGAKPVKECLKLEAIDPLKAPYFTTRREIGLFNGGPLHRPWRPRCLLHERRCQEARQVLYQQLHRP